MVILRVLLLLYLTYFDNVTSKSLEENYPDVDMGNYISKMKDLESKLAMIENLESKVDKMEELESKIAKIANLARVGSLRTCAEYSQYGITTNGMYLVDPDGGLNGEPPFEVFCDFTDGSTQVLHDAEILSDIDHCHDPGCFKKPIEYRDGADGPLIPLSQLEALITLSKSCTQEFVYQCTWAPLKAHGQNYAFWEDRNGEKNYYFHGRDKDSHSCACHFTDEGCAQAVEKGNSCSCDASVPEPLEDTGIITNLNALPIMTIYFGGLRYPQFQNAKFRLGRLKCSGKTEFTEGNSCSALKKEGVMRSGLYNIKKDGDTRTSLVHCDMTGNGYDNVPETDEVSSSSPLGTIAAWVPKVDTDSHEESLPDGWLPCDGTPITKGPWAGGKTPDLNSMGRFLRGGTEEEILTLEDHQVVDHGHIDNGHSHATLPHTHDNSAHSHTSSPHTHENNPHSHSNSPHTHGRQYGIKGFYDGTSNAYVYTTSPLVTSSRSDSTSIDIQSSSVNIASSTVVTHKSSVDIASSTVDIHSSNSGIAGVSSSSNRGDETRPINARVIWIMRVY